MVFLRHLLIESICHFLTGIFEERIQWGKHLVLDCMWKLQESYRFWTGNNSVLVIVFILVDWDVLILKLRSTLIQFCVSGLPDRYCLDNIIIASHLWYRKGSFFFVCPLLVYFYCNNHFYCLSSLFISH